MKQQGVALVLVLWVISLLTIMAASFTLTIRRETAVISSTRDNARARAIAEAGVATAQMMLLSSDKATKWHADGRIYQLNFGNAQVRVRLFDEAGKVDLNHVTPDLLAQVMRSVPATQEQQSILIDSILDWRDEDELVRFHGAEAETYQPLGYQPRNGKFTSLEELQMIQGMMPDVFQWMRAHFTVYGKNEVNTDVAAIEVLQIVFTENPELLEEAMQERLALADMDSSVNQGNAKKNIKASSRYITIIAESALADAVTARVHVLLGKQLEGLGSGFQIIQWQYNYENQASLFAEGMDQWVVKQYAEPEYNN